MAPSFGARSTSTAIPNSAVSLTTKSLSSSLMAGKPSSTGWTSGSFCVSWSVSRSSLLPCRVVVIADYARDLPGSILELPEMNELPFADPFGIFVSGMMKPVHPRLQHPVSLHRENLQRDELSRNLTADILLNTVGQSGFTQSDPALIVIELRV